MDGEKISLCEMTRDLCRELFREWENDPAVYDDPSRFRHYVYSQEAADRYYDAKRQPDRVLLAVLLNGKVIGEVQLKRIDPEKRECTMSIHLQNDSVKGKGYGTRAEKLALEYAFETLNMKAVNADVLTTNPRSARAAEKAGFRFLYEKDGYRYYRAEHDN